MKRSSAKTLSTIGASCMAIVVSSGAWAQAAEGVRTDSGAIQDIVVTARKQSEGIQSIPVAVTAATGASLEKRGIQQIDDLQFVTPSLQISQQMTGGAAVKVALRGQSQLNVSLNSDPAVGIYLDGVNLPRTFGLRANMFDLERVEVVKGPQGTLYGRNTTGGAINLISIKPEFDRISGYVDATLGSFNRTNFSAAINLPLVDDVVAARFALQRTKADGYMHSLVGEEFGGNDQWTARGSLRFEPSPTVSYNIVADWQKLNEQGPALKPTSFGAAPSDGHISPAFMAAGVQLGLLNPADIPVAGPTFFSGITAGYNALVANLSLAPFINNQDGTFYDGGIGTLNKYETWGLSGTLQIELDAATIRLISGYREMSRVGRNDLDVSEFSIVQTQATMNDRFWSQDLNVSGSHGNLTWLAGAYYSDEEGNDASQTIALAGLNPNNPSYFDADVHNRSWAVYTQNTYAVTDRLNLTAGARYTKESRKLTSRNHFGDAGINFACNLPVYQGAVPGDCVQKFSRSFNGWSWLASIDYKVAKDILSYAKVSRGFRSGALNAQGNRNIASFEPVEPEFATEYEIGLKSEMLSRRLRLNLAAFQTDYKDIQRNVTIFAGSTLLSLLRNAAKARIRGAELEALARPVPGLSFNATISYIDAQYTDFVDPGSNADRSHESFDIPAWTYSFGGRFETPIDTNRAIVAGIQAHYSWRGDNDVRLTTTNPTFPTSATTIASYGLLNVRADLNFEDYGLEIAGFVNNLTDEYYFTGQQDFTGAGVFLMGVGKPRTWGVKVTKNF